MDVVRKHCARCNRGIYTTWRTLDNKKYYHPHCFTCVDCGVILESSEERMKKAIFHDEICCDRCYKERLREYNKGTQKQPMDANEIKSDGSTRFDTDDNKNVNVLFSSSGPLFLNDEGAESNSLQQTHNRNDTRSTKKRLKSYKDEQDVETKFKAKLHTQKSSNKSIVAIHDRDSAALEVGNDISGQKSSRIPRPTSAQSKKSLSLTSHSTKSKLQCNQLEKNTKNILYPPTSSTHQTVPTRMHRSVSLVQSRHAGSTSNNVFGNNNPAKHAKSNRYASHSRPRSAVNSTQDEKLIMSANSLPQNFNSNQSIRSSASKRQCAASFSTKRRKEKVSTKHQTIDKNFEREASFQNEIYPRLKEGIPSKQAILKAIRREGSDIPSFKSNGFQLKTSESYDIPQVDHNAAISHTPKRSFNMTFECPICISSLVPAAGGNIEKGYSDGKEACQCRNVVTTCGHLFHGKCMDDWLKIKGNRRCPICSSICLPETLQPVYLECNLCCDLIARELRMPVKSESDGFENVACDVTSASLRNLRTEYETLKAKYNALLEENHNYSFNSTLINSLQSAYEMECRNRLKMQWENRKLLMKIEDLENAKYSY